jgi:hypothetical protein
MAPTTPNINKQLQLLEGFWLEGKTNEYCEQAAKMMKEVLAQEGNNNAINAAASLLQSLTNKEFAVMGPGFQLQMDTVNLATYIAYKDKRVALDRQKKDALLAGYLGRIRGGLISNFEYSHVLANVGPPPRVSAGSPFFSDVDPDAISDPIIRSNYATRIRVNREGDLTNRQQTLLRRMDKFVSEDIVQHMVTTVQKGDVPAEIVNTWLDSAKLDDKERKAVKDAMDAKAKTAANKRGGGIKP